MQLFNIGDKVQVVDNPAVTGVIVASEDGRDLPYIQRVNEWIYAVKTASGFTIRSVPQSKLIRVRPARQEA